MNRKKVLNILGHILQTVGALMALPLICALTFGERDWIYFFAVGAVAVLFGTLLTLIKPKDHVIYAKEGYVIVATSWLVMSAIGALPFVLSRQIPNYVDAFFETVSGFTTTGASILPNVEVLSKSMHFWRSFTHWLGGMGVLVFILAIIPNVSERSIHIIRAEMPGPVVDKLVPKAKDTAKILYLIYIGMTLAEVIMLFAGGMSFYESLVLSFGTAGTGGFAVLSTSIGSYSVYSQWVIGVFMVLFGVNFNLYYLLFLRRSVNAFKSSELWTYLSIVLVSTGIITANVYKIYGAFGTAVRNSFFQVASIISTTGYSTVDFNMWPGLSKGMLLTIMIIGACAGSTAGGIKVSRVVMLFKIISREFKRLLHPRSVSVVKVDGKTVGDDVCSSVLVYLAVYVLCFVFIFLLLSFEPFDIETNISATAACFNNIGPGFSVVGPAGSYAAYSAFSKILLSLGMLLGRLEIFPLLLLFLPSTWLKD